MNVKSRVQDALDETRMLVLGAQILLGFAFRAPLEPVFQKFSTLTQQAWLVGLVALLVSVVLLLWPGAFHRIVEGGEDTERLHGFTTRVADWALLPFAFSLAVAVYVSTEAMLSPTAALLLGSAVGAAAIFFWYGFELMQPNRVERKSSVVTQQKAQEDGKGTSLEEKIRHALTEARVVLPGAQALLGFQLIVMLAPGFENLPQLSKVVHLGSLSLVALSTIFLMAPAAFHRIVEGGEATERMHRFTSCMLIAAMAALAPGMAGDLYVVTQVVTQSAILGTAAAIAAVALCYGLWFGYCLFLRAASAPTGRKEPATA